MDAPPALTDTQAALKDTQAALFEALAHAAEGIAQTVEKLADIYDQAAWSLPDAFEHAARIRRFAAAERAAAAAYRNHEVPAEGVRQVIRDCRPGADDR
jgi:hypothetical protein